jgi:hypothetical protein
MYRKYLFIIMRPKKYIHLVLQSLKSWTNKFFVDTKAKCRHLKRLTCKVTLQQVIMSSQQSCCCFRPSFVNCCPSPLLSGSTPPPPSLCELVYCIHVYSVWGWGSGTQIDNQLPQSPFSVFR